MNCESVIIKYGQRELKINYFYRKGEGPAILYLHGLGCSKKDFETALKCRELEKYSLMAFDLPGSYGSEYPEKLRLTIDGIIEITDLFISNLQMNKIILVGHSMGGLAGLLFAEKFPQKVMAFINVEGNLTSEDCFLSRKAIGISFEEFNGRVWDEIKNIVSSDKSEGDKAYLKNLERADPRAYFDLCAPLVEYSDKGDLVGRFIKLPMPKLYVYGEKNKNLAHIPILKAHMNVLEVPNSGHTPGYDNPTFYYKALAAFIASHHKDSSARI